MIIKYKLILVAIAVFAFSCKQPSAKTIDLPGAGSKVNVHLGAVSPLLSIADTLTAKQNNKAAAKPFCCKGVPSRFSYSAKAAKEK